MFSLRNVIYKEIINEINSLDTSKLTQSEDIPFKLIKDNGDVFANFIIQNFNRCIIDGKFSDQLKKPDVSPETIMIKPLLSKVYESLIYN